VRAAGLLLAACLLAAGEAGAHAELVATVPADGAALAGPPGVLELRFNERVRPVSVRLLDRNGKPLALPAPRADRETIRVAPLPPMEDGRYTLSFRVVSADSHPVSGAIAFAVRAAAPAPQAAMEERDQPGAMRTAVRALRLLALLIGAGGALYLLAIGPFPAWRGVIGLSAGAALAAIMASLGLHGAAMLGDETAVMDTAAWGAALRSTFGLSAAAAGLGAVALAAATRRLAPRAWLATGALLAIASLPMTGHTVTAHPAAAAVAAIAVHGLVAAFWAGSLVGLIRVLRLDDAQSASHSLRRFSQHALPGVALLLVAGVTLAGLQMRSFGDLLDTAYGNRVLFKAVLFAALLALAALNRFVLLPALERGTAQARTRLRASISAEMALIASVVVVTAVLAQTPPHRHDHETRELRSGALTATLSVVPARAGTNRVSVDFAGTAEVAEVSLEMTHEAAGVEPIVRPMKRAGPGRYAWEGGELSFAGEWRIAIHARIGEFDKATFRTRVIIR
jgi:copper transport protein